jgi:hypothetical protein
LIARLAAEQYGVVAHRQLLAAGLDRTAIAYRRRVGADPASAQGDPRPPLPDLNQTIAGHGVDGGYRKQRLITKEAKRPRELLSSPA